MNDVRLQVCVRQDSMYEISATHMDMGKCALSGAENESNAGAVTDDVENG